MAVRFDVLPTFPKGDLAVAPHSDLSDLFIGVSEVVDQRFESNVGRDLERRRKLRDHNRLNLMDFVGNYLIFIFSVLLFFCFCSF